jgi:hypothetical protein
MRRVSVTNTTIFARYKCVPTTCFDPFIQVIILLKPDAHWTHQHGIRNKRKDLHNDTPTATAMHHLA